MFVSESIVVRALVPMMTLDALFEQKGEVAKSVLEELEKVYIITCFSSSCKLLSCVDVFRIAKRKLITLS